MENLQGRVVINDPHGSFSFTTLVNSILLSSTARTDDRKCEND